MLRRLLATSVSAIGLAVAAPAMAQEDRSDIPEMHFGTWGIGTDALDSGIDPGDDFFAYVNSKWLAANPIPADRSRFGVFDYLQDHATYDVADMITELASGDPASGTVERRIVDAYNAFLDTDAIEEAGLAPAQPYLQKIFAAPDLEMLAQMFEQPAFAGVVSAGVTIDSIDPDLHVVSIGFDGMGLPDRDYYLEDSERNLEIRAKYMEFLTAMLSEAGYQDPAAAATAVYDFERQVAELEWDRRILRNPQLTYNKVPREELLALVPEFPLQALLAETGLDSEATYLLPQLPPSEEEIAELGLTPEQQAMIGSGTPGMMRLLTEMPLATIKAYLAVQFLSTNASVLPERIDSANFAFFGQVLGGQTEQRPRKKRAIAHVEGLLGEQVAQLYVQRHFPPRAKAEMEELVGNLKRALQQSITENDWMTSATTQEALSKLASFTAMVGYPDKFEAYEGLEISATDPLGNRLRDAAWTIADNRADLGQPVDRREWLLLPQVVNAYYLPNWNQIVFPAAILQPPFFDPDADPAVNYGAIGAVIGHEIGHGFDDQGSQYDAAGSLRNWWQDADRAAFEARADGLRNLISQYCPVDDGQLCLEGDRSLGETIGDVVGLQIAYRAYRLSLNGEEAPMIDGLTGDQRFFLGFAQIWRDIFRPEALRNQVMSGVHPPAPFRVNNTVRNHDAWYEAFGITPDDDLYIAPEDRVRIW